MPTDSLSIAHYQSRQPQTPYFTFRIYNRFQCPHHDHYAPQMQWVINHIIYRLRHVALCHFEQSVPCDDARVEHGILSKKDMKPAEGRMWKDRITLMFHALMFHALGL